MCVCFFLCFCKQKTAYEMRMSDWSSDVCSSDLSALLDALAPAFSERSREEWMRRLVAADIPAAEVLCISDVLEEPAVRHSEMFEVVDHPVAGPVTLSRRPALFDGSRGAPQRTPPLLGEHNDEILAEDRKSTRLNSSH